MSVKVKITTTTSKTSTHTQTHTHTHIPQRVVKKSNLKKHSMSFVEKNIRTVTSGSANNAKMSRTVPSLTKAMQQQVNMSATAVTAMPSFIARPVVSPRRNHDRLPSPQRHRTRYYQSKHSKNKKKRIDTTKLMRERHERTLQARHQHLHNYNHRNANRKLAYTFPYVNATRTPPHTHTHTHGLSSTQTQTQISPWPSSHPVSPSKPMVFFRTSYIIHHTSYIIHHTSTIIHHTSYIIHHTHHTSYIIHHTSYIIQL